MYRIDTVLIFKYHYLRRVIATLFYYSNSAMKSVNVLCVVLPLKIAIIMFIVSKVTIKQGRKLTLQYKIYNIKKRNLCMSVSGDSSEETAARRATKFGM